MSISRKFALTFSGLTLGLFLALLCLQWFEVRAQTQQRHLFLSEQRTFLRHWITADHQSLLEETRGMAYELSKNSSAALSSPLPSSDTQIWELDSSGNTTIHRSGNLRPDDVKLLDTTSFLKGSLRPEGGWFYFHNNGAFYNATYAPTQGRQNWLLQIREWDPGFLRKLSTLMDGSVSLGSVDRAESQPDGDRYLISHNLNDWRGQPLMAVTAHGRYPFSAATWTESKTPVIVFLTFGVSVIFTLALSLHRWVITPLNDIKASLINEQIKPVIPYLNRSDEIGRVARLIENTGAQRDALRKSESELQNALDERNQLGRDLHDGIIQSLYGTGMTLATIQARLPGDDAINRASLDQSRASLNEAILDLRNFITGLEPEAIKQPTFTAAITGLINSTETELKVKTKCSIDENLARQLSITQRAHLLQITREALSNALRHGEATEVSAELQVNGSYVEYHFRDNGRGFTTTNNSAHEGHGLENLSNRARDLGATFSVQSTPGMGTHLKLTFELSRTKIA